MYSRKVELCMTAVLVSKFCVCFILLPSLFEVIVLFVTVSNRGTNIIFVGNK